MQAELSSVPDFWTTAAEVQQAMDTEQVQQKYQILDSVSSPLSHLPVGGCLQHFSKI